MRLVQSLHAFRCDADHGRGDRSPPLGRVDRPCLRSRKESPYCLTTKASLATSKPRSTAPLRRPSRQRYGRLDELDGPPYLQSGMVGYIALREMMTFVHESTQWTIGYIVVQFVPSLLQNVQDLRDCARVSCGVFDAHGMKARISEYVAGRQGPRYTRIDGVKAFSSRLGRGDYSESQWRVRKARRGILMGQSELAKSTHLYA